MKDCVEDGTAFVTKGDECFMYYKKTKEAFADAVSIYGKNYPLMMMAMIAGIPKHVPEDKKDTIFLYLTLHIGKDIKSTKECFQRQQYTVTGLMVTDYLYVLTIS